jgi:2',3'-cyclic-nucleotide 2'-phosphodiesterase (5'-nucleotidase family)
MKLKKYTLYIGLFILSACSPTLTIQSSDSELIGISTSADSTLLAIISPYQKGIETEMNEVLTYSKITLTKRGSESLLGNFVTDLCLNYADAHLCVMNSGGLRTTLNKGNITRGKLYELMPFENELVVLELDKTDYLGLLAYICKRGGEPFSGITIVMDKEGEVITNSWPVNFENGEKVKVLTSDYLANGGDKMSFFKDKEQIKVGLKLRDAIIDYCSNTDTINAQLDGRIKIVDNE